METFYIITNYSKDENYEVTRQIQDYIEKRGRTCILCERDEEGNLLTDQIPKETDCVLTLGGDGTLIQAVRELRNKHLPLIGVNMGTLGYLTEIELPKIEESLEKLFCGAFLPERRMMLQGKLEGRKEDIALNDIVVARAGSIRVIHFNIYVNGQLLNSYQADGVIISTPTGSTAYNLSAGGPIVEPTAEMFVITPICSHALNTSSIVLSAEDEIVIEIGKGKGDTVEEASVTFDGADVIPVYTGDRITISRSEKTAKLLKLSEELAEQLNKAGFQVTQATVSRDIRDLRLTKVAGENGKQKYVILQVPEKDMKEKYMRILKDGYVSMEMAQNILVVKTVSGMAMAVAASIDSMQWYEVVGCIAGDDTIMCAVRSTEETKIVMEKIRKIVL